MKSSGPSLHVLFAKEALDPARLRDKVVIAIDILFATSTLAHVLAEGAADVRLAYGEDDAHQLEVDVEKPLLAGEYNADTIAGFAPATPLALAEHGVRGRNLIYASTNGTVALLRAAPAAHVYAASLLNGAAVARHVGIAHPQASVLLLCAGSAGRFNLEDSYGAGHLAAHLLAHRNYSCTDAAWAALHIRSGHEPLGVLAGSHIGRMMCARGLSDEVAFAARTDTLDVVPVLGERQRIWSVT
ncbi:MAG TPA: 2-phosphosulfolactate phosphatase [Steroidobacteraceae bacterium]|nr:2-phosphosulfolactate phosphatase [Steroidobacteraceae bacterium]